MVSLFTGTRLSAIAGLIALAVGPASYGKLRVFTHGCAGKVISVSALGFQGQGVTTAMTSRRAPQAVALAEGGYNVEVSDGKCVGEGYVGILGGRIRSVNIELHAPDSQSSGLSAPDIYVSPRGYLAGTLGEAGVTVVLRKAGASHVAIVEGGAYYLDGIPAGSYELELSGNGWRTTRIVAIPDKFKMRVENL